ncbi:MAG TPA: hypothetical protein VNK52_16150 [Hyphomicrobiaceae bacterium]|nr:hypothetical protein [Hyphomicrobiaceae bacterium]
MNKLLDVALCGVALLIAVAVFLTLARFERVAEPTEVPASAIVRPWAK